MKKITVTGLVIALGLILLTGAVYAWGTGGSYGSYGSGYGSGSYGYGCGMGYGTPVNTTSLNKFLQETQDLRNQLINKQLELRDAYNDPNHDPVRIAQLQQEIVALQIQIQAIATKYGIPAWVCAGYMTGPGYCYHY